MGHHQQLFESFLWPFTITRLYYTKQNWNTRQHHTEKLPYESFSHLVSQHKYQHNSVTKNCTFGQFSGSFVFMWEHFETYCISSFNAVKCSWIRSWTVLSPHLNAQLLLFLRRTYDWLDETTGANVYETMLICSSFLQGFLSSPLIDLWICLPGRNAAL